MKKVIAFLLCLCFVLSGCSASTAETQPETTEATPTTVATEAPTEAEAEAPTETDGTQEESTAGEFSVSAETAAVLIESTLKDSFENVSVTCDGSTIVIDIWQTGIRIWRIRGRFW